MLRTKPVPGLPKCADTIQYTDAAFPADYLELGLRQLMRLKRDADYFQAVSALGHRLATAIAAAKLSATALNFNITPSAWEAETRANPQSHSSGTISKTCFVYVSRSGWDWQPYEAETPEKIGAMAQTISGHLVRRSRSIHPLV